ncbi:MAG: aldose 1-epimerase [Lachnospiraceae bacterium]|nr:aldose 1-epimerase [Lachnospiraceae bacterium]
MTVSAKKIDYKGEECVELAVGDYVAYIAPFIGSNVIRLYHSGKDIELLRYDKDAAMEDLKASPEIYGLPTLYLPNRLADGKLKTSDATYQFPVNEPQFNTHLHGFLHKRLYEVCELTTGDDSAMVKTAYTYDEKDEAFTYFPVSFRSEIQITLTPEGLSYTLTMTNLSQVQMPFGICSHTAFPAPFTKGGDGMDVRLYIPIGDKCEIDEERRLATEELLPLDGHDKQYLTGSMIPVHQPLDTEMYFGEVGVKDDAPFYGSIATDIKTGTRICYEVDREYKFFIVWNDWGEKGYFCVEPQTWMVNAPNLSLLPETTGYQELAPGESKTLVQKLYLA